MSKKDIYQKAKVLAEGICISLDKEFPSDEQAKEALTVLGYAVCMVVGGCGVNNGRGMVAEVEYFAKYITAAARTFAFMPDASQKN